MNVPQSVKNAWSPGFRVGLYFLCAFLPVLGKSLQKHRDAGTPITGLDLIVMFIWATYQGCLIIRVYFDNSAEKLKQEQQNKS